MRLGVWLSVCLWSACTPATNAAAVLELALSVSDDNREPLPEVPLRVQGEPAGVTDASGRLAVRLQTSEPRVSVSAQCPDDYHDAESRSLSRPQHGEVPRLQVHFSCRPRQRSLLLLVRAPQVAGSPVLVDGEIVGAVGEDGTLHSVVKRETGSEVRFAIDTSQFAGLTPQYPTRAIRVAEQDELVVFDQSFQAAQPEGVKRKLKRAPVSTPSLEPVHRPYAIGSRF